MQLLHANICAVLSESGMHRAHFHIWTLISTVLWWLEIIVHVILHFSLRLIKLSWPDLKIKGKHASFPYDQKKNGQEVQYCLWPLKVSI